MNAQDLEHLGRDFKQLQAAYCELAARVAALEQRLAASGTGDQVKEAQAAIEVTFPKRGPGRPRKTEG